MVKKDDSASAKEDRRLAVWLEAAGYAKAVFSIEGQSGANAGLTRIEAAILPRKRLAEVAAATPAEIIRIDAAFWLPTVAAADALRGLCLELASDADLRDGDGWLAMGARQAKRLISIAIAKSKMAALADEDARAESSRLWDVLDQRYDTKRGTGELRGVNREYKAYRRIAETRGEKALPYPVYIEKIKSDSIRLLVQPKPVSVA